MSKIFDISLTVHPEMVVWPGDPPVSLERLSKIEDGANCNVSFLGSGVHAGTHVDAPYHFLPQGTTIETLPLDVLVGPAQVVQIPEEATLIDRAVLEMAGILPGVVRVLFKTRNTRIHAETARDFAFDFVGISPDAAEWLVERGVKLVGVDYLSVAPYNNSRPTHEILLGQKVVLLEGILLEQVEPGLYTLVCLPVKLKGSDGAPARTILIQD